mgnify:CR=1 FL=1
MSKATHTGRLRTIREVTENVRGSIGIGTMKCLLNHGGTLFNLEHEEIINKRFLFILDGVDYRLRKDMFTDLKPIKPVIEIPKCPFWFRNIYDDLCNIIELNNKKYTGRNLVFDCGFEISDNEVNRLLNDGSWTICEEPKKVMRPFTDDELKEWAREDGWFIAEDVELKITGISKGAFWYSLVTDNSVVSTSFVAFIHNFTDRHGNKFEKVAE